MPVFIYEKDALQKMAEVEGREWLEQQEEFGMCSFGAFLNEWNKKFRDRPDLREEGKDLGMSVESNGAIYGSWGFNRYLVYYSGEIVFLRCMSHDEEIKKAEKAGFRIV